MIKKQVRTERLGKNTYYCWAVYRGLIIGDTVEALSAKEARQILFNRIRKEF
jgi:hypothetical protein